MYEPAHFLSKLLEDRLHKNKGVNQEKLIKMTQLQKESEKGGVGTDPGSNTREREKEFPG